MVKKSIPCYTRNDENSQMLSVVLDNSLYA